MLDGREALARIDRAIMENRHEADALAQRLAALNDRELALRDGLRKAIEELARFRLDHLRAGEVTASIEGVGRNVEALMRAREDQLSELAKRETGIAERIEELESRRAELVATVDRASEEIDDAEATLQQALEARADFRERQAKVEAADAIAAEADNKLALAKEDRRVKGEPYESDPLFMYLWRRGYGTSAYRSGGVIRMLDRWVAGLVHFEGARRNYHVLTEIPARLGEHADRMRATADAELEALVALEAAARAQSPLAALEAGLGQARDAVEAVDAEIAGIRKEARETETRRASFTRGEDEHYRKAVATIAAVLDDRSLSDMRNQARRTPMPEDDRIVGDIAELEEDLDDVADERKQLRELADKAVARSGEFEDMRDEFRRRRYDDTSSVFQNDGLFGAILAEFVRGAISGSAYWDRLDGQHRRRAGKSKIDFGSSRFRFPKSRGTRPSRGSSGGFRSGGGTSGGGFRTGGGF